MGDSLTPLERIAWELSSRRPANRYARHQARAAIEALTSEESRKDMERVMREAPCVIKDRSDFQEFCAYGLTEIPFLHPECAAMALCDWLEA